MKTKYFISIFLFTFPIFLFGQSKIDTLIQIPPTKVETFNIEGFASNHLFAKMNYGTAQILNREEIKNNLIGKKIINIALVYTDFTRSNTFSQPKLNRNRFNDLLKINSEIFKDTTIKWEVIAQTSAKSASKGKELFHGFVITYKASLASLYLSELVSKTNKELPDSTVLNVFERNKEWKDMLIVSDLTGSMTPYVAQVLVWLRLNLKTDRVKHFTFFNDGDLAIDSTKEIGNTGGIYHSNEMKFNTILNLAQQTMINGFGGDTPENDIEAILEGLNTCSNCGDIVLIADNISKMRDYELIEKIGKPVKVIICGYTGIVNPEYLNLALKTKGSIHTIEKDITSLMKINEGQIIKIDKYQYIIKDGKFKILGRI